MLAMNYDTLHSILKDNAIHCGYEKQQSIGRHGLESSTTALYITDDPVLLSRLKDRIENILLENKVNARVDILPNDDKVIIKLN